MREFQAEIDRLPADAADPLRGVNFLLVRFKLRTLGAVVIGAQIRLGSGCVRHVLTSFGYKNSTLGRCFTFDAVFLCLNFNFCRKFAYSGFKFHFFLHLVP